MTKTTGTGIMTAEEYRAQKPSKYRNKKTVVNGITFDSKKEAEHYVVLLWEVERGVIWDLQLQPKFKMHVGDIWICTYIADFSYVHNKFPDVLTVDDTKGAKTAVYQIKKKLFKACYPQHRHIET